MTPMPTPDEIRAALARAGHHGPEFPSLDRILRVGRELHITHLDVMLAYAGLDAAQARGTLTPAELDATLDTFRRTGVIGPTPLVRLLADPDVGKELLARLDADLPATVAEVLRVSPTTEQGER